MIVCPEGCSTATSSQGEDASGRVLLNKWLIELGVYKMQGIGTSKNVSMDRSCKYHPAVVEPCSVLHMKHGYAKSQEKQ